MKTLADLRAVKEKAKQEMAMREQSAKYRISVAMGTCGIAAGARNVMSAILDEISKRGIQDAAVSQTGCLGCCDQEPLVQVTGADNNTITYSKVSPETARQIIADHVQAGRVVSEHVFNMG
ncbi:(2Fe-2S) ferredoxin domain-containing protein [candidate division KSB1 bacterium]|nr:(2Fe-2S) ferredoxin domain-containing protein [candidate division KSB1 bacterium]